MPLAALQTITNKTSIQPEQAGHFHLCTVANYEHPNLAKLKESCRKYGIDLVVLGMGLPYLSNGTKLVRIASYLDSLPDNDIVMFVDAFDVLVVSDKQTILKKFFEFDAPIVMSAEKNCFPYSHLADHFLNTPSPFKFINTGCWIGYVEPVKKWLKALSPEKHELEDDQAQITLHYLLNRQTPYFKMDHSASLFLCLFKVADEEVLLQDHSIRCLTTGSTPCIVHANGNSFCIWNRVYNKIIRRANAPGDVYPNKLTDRLKNHLHIPEEHLNALKLQHETLNILLNYL